MPMQRKFSLAYLTLPGVEPVEQIRIAKEAGYDFVSLRTIPMGQVGEPQTRLEKDPALFEEVKKTLAETGMKMLDLELVRIREDLVEDLRGPFEKAALLGATQVLSSVWTKDRTFAADRYAAVCEQAAQFGLTVNLEFPVVSELKSMREALELQERVGAANLKVMLDMAYVHLDGVQAADILAVAPERFGLVHLCDWPKDFTGEDFAPVVRGARAYCGEGCVDIASIVKALPESCPISIELPNFAEIEARGRVGHAAQCLKTAKEYFAANGL